MKVLIWIAVIFIGAFVKALVFGGRNLGAIPEVIFYCILCGAAKAWCDAYDRRHGKKEAEKKAEQKVKTVFKCKHCGYELTGWYKQCPKCGMTDSIEKLQLTVEKDAAGGLAAEEKTVPPAEEKKQKIMFCRKCGAKLLDDSAFCNQCGAAVNKE